jgi:glycosyltransferase involved in cell wall biosynthesis
MKILYVGALDPAGTCKARLDALQDLEPDVHSFDVDNDLRWGGRQPLLRSIEDHLKLGPTYSGANRALLERARALRPDLVWIDKGDWVWSSSLRALRGLGCFLVHHVTDSLFTRHARARLRRRLLRSTAPDYDVFFTTNMDDVARIAGREPPKTLLTHLGHDHRRFEPSPLPPELAERWNDELVFIGHFEPETEDGILALVDAGLPVRVYGHLAWFRSSRRDRLGDRLRGPLSKDDYVHALKGSKIGLCFVSTMNYNQTASRSFEITGCGSFLLAVRTPQHLEAFEEGVEAEFFGDHAELVEKARYYLQHDEERERIARAGLERNQASGYSWDALMKRDWPRVLELYRARQP